MQESPPSLDAFDWQLLAEISPDSRITQNPLSEVIARSPTANARRQAAMEKAGVIAGYEAKLDLRRLGHGTIVNIKIALGSQRAEVLEA